MLYRPMYLVLADSVPCDRHQPHIAHPFSLVFPHFLAPHVSRYVTLTAETTHLLLLLHVSAIDTHASLHTANTEPLQFKYSTQSKVNYLFVRPRGQKSILKVLYHV